MNPRVFLYALLFIYACSASEAQRNFDEVEITSEQLAENLYVLFGSGGNIGVLVGDDGVFMIDDQFAPLADKIKAAIQGLSDHPVKYLVNTHWHGDHTGGNEAFGNDGAIIVAHENVRQRLSTDQLMKAFGRTVPASPEVAWPQITFTDDLTFHVNGEDVMVFHVHEAHTDGDALVYFPKNNVLHMGDTYFKDRFPFIDLGSGGSIDGLIGAIEAALLISDVDTQIIPGHGTMASKVDLTNYRNMLQTMRDRVKKALADGQTLEEMKKAGLDEGYESWGTGFIPADKFIDVIWTDLTGAEQ